MSHLTQFSSLSKLSTVYKVLVTITLSTRIEIRTAKFLGWSIAEVPIESLILPGCGFYCWVYDFMIQAVLSYKFLFVRIRWLSSEVEINISLCYIPDFLKKSGILFWMLLDDFWWEVGDFICLIKLSYFQFENWLLNIKWIFKIWHLKPTSCKS